MVLFCYPYSKKKKNFEKYITINIKVIFIKCVMTTRQS